MDSYRNSNVGVWDDLISVIETIIYGLGTVAFEMYQ
jgi:hypothetical protein